MKGIFITFLAAAALPALAITVPEPETTFYGRILNLSGPQPYLVTSGTLQWTVSKSDSEALEFTVELSPLAEGKYSYRLAIPHSALSLDLEPDPASLPLAGSPSSHQHLVITVDGQPASLTRDAAASFDVQQAARASTYRLDLELQSPLPDSDGDGLADWWEDRYGLDKQNDDRHGDLDGDGLTNLAEFLAGTDPTLDNRVPILRTSTVPAAVESLNGILLLTIDSDTPPSGLVYTLTSAPTAGTLILRNVERDPGNSDRELAAGSTFTQQQLNRGHLVYQAEAGTADPRFVVSVHDGNPDHSAATGTVTIKLSRPEVGLVDLGTPAERVALALDPSALEGVAGEEEERVRRFILGRDGGYILWDLSGSTDPQELSSPSSGASFLDHLADYGMASRALIRGGEKSDVLSGGLAPDLLVGGPGDDTLTGGGGSDRFLLLGPGDGADTITDFQRAEGDLLDLSRILRGASRSLSDYAQVTSSGSDLVLDLDLDGDRSGFTDLSVTLSGAAGTDLYTLWSEGHLLTDGLSLPPRLELTASPEPASENGPTPASFTISLDRPAEQPLEIGLFIAGSATNGVDYVPLPGSISVPVGAESVSLPVTPYQDALSEPLETVHLTLRPGSGYQLGARSSAEITLADLLPEVTVSALVPTARRDAGTAGAFLIERSAIIDRSVLVRLDLSGTASMGNDFEAIQPFVNLAAGQTTAIIEVIPMPDASLDFGAESVRLAVAPNPSYRTDSARPAEVRIVDSLTSLSAWRSTHFPDLENLSLPDFLNQDPGDTGISILLRYAFALNPHQPRAPRESSHLPGVRLQDGHLVIEFTRLLHAGDLRWVVESSSDLRSWSSRPDQFEDISGSLNLPDPRRTAFRLKDSVQPGTAAFLRVRPVHQP